jgi:hypothetical protein
MTRKCAVMVLFLCLLTTPVYAMDWSDKTLGIGNDKIFHFAVGYTINEYGKHKHWTPLERFLAVFSVAEIKEMTDKKRDKNDVLATIAPVFIMKIRF